MLYNIKKNVHNTAKILIMLGLILVGWTYAHQYFPQEVAEHRYALKINNFIAAIEQIAEPLMNSRAISSILLKLNPPNYAENIKTIKANQIAHIIKSRSTEKKKPLLVFIYDLDCLECDDMFDDVNDYASSLTNETSVVMSIALAQSKTEFINYLRKTNQKVFFKPIMLIPNDKNKLAVYLSKIDKKFQKTPYLAYVSEAGNIRTYNQKTYTSGQLQTWLTK